MTTAVGYTILGVDPSLNRTGWAAMTADGAVLGSGVISPVKAGRAEQLFDIMQQFSRVLSEWSPRAVAMEHPGSWQRRFGSRRETIEAMAMARAAMIIAAAERLVDVAEIPVPVVRAKLLGKHNAGLDQVQKFLERRGLVVPRRPRGGADMDIAVAMLMAIYGLEEEVVAQSGS